MINGIIPFGATFEQRMVAFISRQAAVLLPKTPNQDAMRILCWHMQFHLLSQASNARNRERYDHWSRVMTKVAKMLPPGIGFWEIEIKDALIVQLFDQKTLFSALPSLSIEVQAWQE